MVSPKKLALLYKQGVNISNYLRDHNGVDHNTDEIIEISYDLQAGSYIRLMEQPDMAQHLHQYSSEIARVINSLCQPTTVLEAGVGEATTLSGVIKHLSPEVKSYGFDLSWSRVAYAKEWLLEQGLKNATLCTGNLFNIPFSNDSIDVVYTSHSIEPNGGSEREILKELFRVARNYLILLEPGYELVGENARKRMEFYGYCRNLKGVAEELGYKVITHELFPYTSNPLNATAITIIEKKTVASLPENALACPKYKSPLKFMDEVFYSEEAQSVYPIIGGIPCLREENSIVATKYGVVN